MQCLSSKHHKGHEIVDIGKTLESKKKVLEMDLQELVKRIYPKYKEIVSNIPVQKDDLNKNSVKLKTALDKQGEELHREIDTTLRKLKSDVEEMESKHLDILKQQEDDIKRSISEIIETIVELKELLNSSDLSLVSAYQPRNAKFRRLPPKVEVSLPCFTPKKVSKDYIYQQFGSISASSIKTKEHESVTKDFLSFDFSPSDKLLIDNKVRIIADVNTVYRGSNKIHSVSCLSDYEVWTRGLDNIIRLYNIHGTLLKSIQTESGNQPFDIAVTRIGELVYTDFNERTVNIVKNKKIKTVIRLKGWGPLQLCSTSSGDLLVVMINDFKLAKVVRYSGSTEKQTIQYNEKGQLLYSSDAESKNIVENRNQDICVADNYARAVVVVDHKGKFRFLYTGRPSSTMGRFEPLGITTDSQGRILTIDIKNQCIHILNVDGHFLCYIYTSDLREPYDLCVDTRDNLFVAEFFTGQVKKIQFNM